VAMDSAEDGSGKIMLTNLDEFGSKPVALAKQMFEINGTNAPVPAANTAPVEPPVNGQDAKAKAKAEKAAATAKTQASQKSEADRAALAAAKAAGDAQASKAKNEKKEKPVTATAASTPPQKGTVIDNTYAGQDLGMKQLAAPQLPISSSKAERLQALLDKYKADQITPDEYHQQRAAILAVP